MLHIAVVTDRDVGGGRGGGAQHRGVPRCTRASVCTVCLQPLVIQCSGMPCVVQDRRPGSVGRSVCLSGRMDVRPSIILSVDRLPCACIVAHVKITQTGVHICLSFFFVLLFLSLALALHNMDFYKRESRDGIHSAQGTNAAPKCRMSGLFARGLRAGLRRPPMNNTVAHTVCAHVYARLTFGLYNTYFNEISVFFNSLKMEISLRF